MKNLRPQDLRIGNSVKVKKGVRHSYLEKYDIGGFEGRVFHKFKDMDVWSVEMEFDSITLKGMPVKYIKDNIKDGTDYACIDIYLKDVVKSKARDNMEDVRAARKAISKKTGFVSILDEERKDLWEEPEKKEKKTKAKSDRLEVLIAMAKAREFIVQFERVQEKKKLIDIEAKKIDPSKKIDVEDFLKCVFVEESVKKILLGGKDKPKPFRYVEDITKEKFIAVPGLKDNSWWGFLFSISQHMDFSKYKNASKRILVDHFKIDIKEVLTSLFGDSVQIMSVNKKHKK